jgi:hypothetical protein
MTAFEFGARRFLLGMLFIILASSVQAEVGDAEKDAGHLSGFAVVEFYRAIGVTTAPSATRKSPEVEAEIARDWAKTFCTAASRDFQWNRRWKLIVYASGQSHRTYSCVIARTTEHLKRDFDRKPSEGRIGCEDKGSLFQPVDEIE